MGGMAPQVVCFECAWGAWHHRWCAWSDTWGAWHQGSTGPCSPLGCRSRVDSAPSKPRSLPWSNPTRVLGQPSMSDYPGTLRFKSCDHIFPSTTFSHSHLSTSAPSASPPSSASAAPAAAGGAAAGPPGDLASASEGPAGASDEAVAVAELQAEVGALRRQVRLAVVCVGEGKAGSPEAACAYVWVGGVGGGGVGGGGEGGQNSGGQWWQVWVRT